MFINELPEIVASPEVNTDELLLTMLLYADDMCCISYSREGLQTALDKLSDYCDKWGLTVNIKKTKKFPLEKWQDIPR